MPTAFITGITGQDGSYLAEQLLAEGFEVHGLVTADDVGARALRERTPQVWQHLGDLRDQQRLEQLLAEVGPDEVYHLGGLSSVAASWEEPVLYAQVVGLATLQLLDILWQRHERGLTTRAVLASSSEVFGIPQVSPQDEATPIRPRSPYGAAKAFAQHIAAVYRHRGLPVSTVVLYNHESPRRSQAFVTRKITKAVADIVRGEAHELVLGDLDARRDWGWAPDYVDAMVRAMRRQDSGEFVIATGVDHSVRDFVEAAFGRVGISDWEPLVRHDSALTRPVDPVRLVGDATKAGDLLGWQPTVPFEEIVARMVDADLDR